MGILAERITEALATKVLTKPELAQALGIDPTASPITPDYQAFSSALQDLRNTGVIFIARDPNQERVEASGGEYARYYRSADERHLQDAGVLVKHKHRGTLEKIDLLTDGEQAGVISPKTAKNWRDFFKGETRNHPQIHPPRRKR